jgi:hypothetical protein
MLKQHELERNLEGEIVQLKKERLIHTTRCQVYETVAGCTQLKTL